ncbi:MAG: hypothetical protein IKN09_04390, partial [Clostridia bacterium]|nr:hypothetical protein [Clostridia bacterium]
MNTDNNNFENKVGSESMGFAQNPINNSPANNLGEETFSPFQDLNNAPLNVPTDNISAAPIQNKAPDNLTFDQPSVQPQMPAQDLSFQGPVNTSNVDNSFVAPTPTTSVDQLNDAINQVPVQDNNINQGTTSFDSMQSAPAVDNSFVATQAAPTMDSFNQTVAPTFNAAPVDDLQSTPNMGINDVVNQNQYTTTSPSVETPSIEMPTNEGPTLPIPDQMPMNDYQAGVSTPVDYATPMSDFDQIGTTPELDPKAKGSKKKNKGALLILLILLIAALGGGSYYLINIKGIFNKDNVTVKEVVAEKNEALSTNIDDYATFKDTSSSNCVLDTSKVDISAVGTYDFTVTCGEKSYTGKVTVKDTKGPEIAVKTNIVTAGSSITPEMLVKNSNETAT